MNLRNILFVGAGPIGLATAIQAKIRNSDLDITLLDKQENYVRTQNLRIDKSYFSAMPDHEELNTIMKSFYSKSSVPIQQMESDLKELAKKIGIQFRNYNVNADSFPELLEEYPEVGCIVGADGAHSFIRENVFGEKFKVMDSVEYLVQVKYTTKEATQKLGWKQKISSTILSGTFVEESVSKNGKEVSLRFFVDEKTFKAIEKAKAKNPWEVSDKRVPKALKKKIDHWIQDRSGAYNEELIDAPFLTGIELKVYSAKRTVKEVNGRIYCLVGDAAGGVPFFKSINKGFQESSALSKALAEASTLEENTKKVTSKFKIYENKTKSIAFWENLAAKVKACFINMIISMIRFTKGIMSFRLFSKAPRCSVSLVKALT